MIYEKSLDIPAIQRSRSSSPFRLFYGVMVRWRRRLCGGWSAGRTLGLLSPKKNALSVRRLCGCNAVSLGEVKAIEVFS